MEITNLGRSGLPEKIGSDDRPDQQHILCDYFWCGDNGSGGGGADASWVIRCLSLADNRMQGTISYPSPTMSEQQARSFREGFQDAFAWVAAASAADDPSSNLTVEAFLRRAL